MARRGWIWFALPATLVFLAFWLLPMIRLAWLGQTGRDGGSAYLTVLSEPLYWRSLFNTVLLSAAATLVTLVLAVPVARFLAHHREFRGRGTLIALLTFPLAFPGVVVGFLIILLAGRQGILADLTQRIFNDPVVFAYGMAGLFLGYLYFSLPRAISVLTAAAEQIDPALPAAARTLGANAWQRFAHIELPALKPALIAAGAMSFATSMGAFGTAFTLATQINVLPLTIYNEFTNYANIPVAAALSILLGLITWLILAVAHHLADAQQGAGA